ncbi:Hypp2072 [Branchiostoma lanceolatum]|uniref:Hypp2072 protein n=1 Tax=Branchiostoma lanceolatum TaxID=7740 RepID=A0A8K0ENU1_BRALA|nr:Hypp2072 [Branchiostoma lanceolatum]
MKRLLVLAAILVVAKAQGGNEGDSDPEAALKTVEQKGERLLSLLLNKLKHDRRAISREVQCIGRGQIDPTLEGTIRLCSACWSYKQLGPDYSPPFVNEIRCTSDTRCLSGFGGCIQRTERRDIQHQIGGIWRRETLSVGVDCDCGVMVGGALHPFIRA